MTINHIHISQSHNINILFYKNTIQNWEYNQFFPRKDTNLYFFVTQNVCNLNKSKMSRIEISTKYKNKSPFSHFIT